MDAGARWRLFCGQPGSDLPFLFGIRADVKAVWEEGGVAESSGGRILCMGLGVETGLGGGEMIERVPAAVGLRRHPCVGSRGAESMRRKRGLRAAKSTSGPVGVEVRWYWQQDAVWILNERLCKGCFSRFGRQVTHPKFQSYVKANPELEKQEMNLLLWAGRSQFSYYPRWWRQDAEPGEWFSWAGQPTTAAWGKCRQPLWDGGRLAKPPTGSQMEADE